MGMVDAMKAIYISVIKSIFDMFIGCFKQVQKLSRTDKPWQEWLKFFLFMALTAAVVWFAFSVSIEIIDSMDTIK